MALILCPECHNQISDKAEQCPYCGLPAKYFLQEPSVKQDMTALLTEKCDYKNLGNVFPFEREMRLQKSWERIDFL